MVVSDGSDPVVVSDGSDPVSDKESSTSLSLPSGTVGQTSGCDGNNQGFSQAPPV